MPSAHLHVHKHGHQSRGVCCLPVVPHDMVGPACLVQQHQLGKAGCAVLHQGPRPLPATTGLDKLDRLAAARLNVRECCLTYKHACIGRRNSSSVEGNSERQLRLVAKQATAQLSPCRLLVTDTMPCNPHPMSAYTPLSSKGAEVSVACMELEGHPGPQEAHGSVAGEDRVMGGCGRHPDGLNLCRCCCDCAGPVEQGRWHTQGCLCNLAPCPSLAHQAACAAARGAWGAWLLLPCC